jgi:uncharacterized membrane protein HdeD (DUF308 family)
LEDRKVKRKTREMVTPNRKISGKDYYQIFTSIFMVILGAIILFRSMSHSAVIMPLLVGVGFLALGVYRLIFVVRYFKERRKWR